MTITSTQQSKTGQSSPFQTGTSSGGGADITSVAAPRLESSTTSGTAAHMSIELSFNTAMARGTGSIFITDGAIQTVIDRASGQPTTRIVGATDTREIPVSAVAIDGNHVTLDASGLKAGHTYTVVMGAGVLVNTENRAFAGVTSPKQVSFVPVADDTQPPTVSSIELDGGVLKAGASMVLTIKFSEAVASLDPAAIQVPNAVLSDLHKVGDGSTWQASVTAAGNTSAADNVASINMSMVRDAAGNAGNVINTSGPYLVDTVAPLVASIALDGAALNAAHGIGVTIKFSERVEDLPSAALSTPHATLSGLATSDNGTTWHATLTGDAATTSTGDALSIDMSMLRDLAGNAGSGTLSSPDRYDVDTAAPTASITLDRSALAIGDEIDVTITFSEAVTNLPAAAIGTPNARLEHLGTDDNGRTWHAKLSAAGSGIDDATNALSIDMSKVQDRSGNAGSGTSSSGNYAVDTMEASLSPVILVVDNGPSATDNITNQMHVSGVIIGQLAAWQELELTIDGHAIAGSRVSTSGDGAGAGNMFWYFTPVDGEFADGPHHVTARLAGGSNSNVVVTKDITLETTAPLVLSSPVSAEPFKVSDEIVIEFNQAVYLNSASGGHDTIELVRHLGDVASVSTQVYVDASNFSPDHTRLIISANDHHLVAGANYSIGLPRYLTDLAGNQVGEHPTYFSTAAEITYTDTAAPHARLATAYSDSDLLRVGDTVQIRVFFNEPIGLAGGAEPALLLNTGGVARYTSISADGRELRLEYTITEGDRDVGRLEIADSSGLVGHIADLAGHVLEAAHIDFSSLENALGYGNLGPIAIDGNSPLALSAPVLDGGSDSGASATDRLTNKATPGLHGTGAETGAAIDLYEGTTWVGQGHSDASGNWWAEVASYHLLDDGEHVLTVRQSDAAGNQSAVSAALSVTIDTIAPGAPSGPVLAAASDTGISLSDAITRLTTPTFSGNRADPLSTVRLYDGERLVGTAESDASGAWSITASALPEGVRSMRATQVDRAGNESAASTALAVTVDISAPAALAAPLLAVGSDSGLSQLDGITRVTTPTLNGSGADPHTTVRLYDGNKLVGETTSSDTGAWSITASALANGARTLTAKQVDLAGYESAAMAALTITIDTAAPAALAAPLLAVASDSGLIDGITRVATPTFSGSAEPHSTVRLYDGDRLLGEVDSGASGAWSITASVLADGAHALSAKQTDRAGNESAASALLTVTIDTTAPAALAAPLLDALSDSGVIDRITNIATPTITGIGADPNSTVRLYDGDKLLGTTESNNAGGWSFTAGALPDGVHALTAKQLDRAGNESAASTALTVTIDTVGPAALAAPLLAVASDSGIVDGITRINTPTLSGSGADPHAIVRVYDGTKLVREVESSATGAWSFTAGALADGVHTLTAKQLDLAGNESAGMAALTLTVDTIAPAALAAPLLAVANQGGITRITTPTISGSGAEPHGTVRLYDGDKLLGEVESGANGAWSITASVLAEGAHALSAKQVDRAGNESAASDLLSVTIDTVAPIALAAPLLASDSGILDGITRVTTPIFTGTGAEPYSIVKLYDGATEVGTANSGANGTWSITASALSNGLHTLTAKQFDRAGNESPASTALNITIDTIAAAPVAPLLAALSDTGVLDNDGITNNTAPAFLGAGVEPGATVRLFDGDTNIGEVTANANGAWSITANALLNGVRQISAMQIDVAGNESTRSTQTQVTIDTIAPTVIGKVASGLLGGTYSLKFSEQIVFAKDGQFDLFSIGLLGILSPKKQYRYADASDWSIVSDAAGLQGTLKFQVPLLGDFKMKALAGSVEDLAGNVAIIGTPDLDFTIPLL